MSWEHVFKNYQLVQTAEIGKKGKVVTSNNEQVSQFSLFPPEMESQIEEIKIPLVEINNLEELAYLDLEQLMIFLKKKKSEGFCKCPHCGKNITD